MSYYPVDYPLYYYIEWPKSQEWLDKVDEYGDFIVPTENNAVFVDKVIFETEYGL